MPLKLPGEAERDRARAVARVEVPTETPVTLKTPVTPQVFNELIAKACTHRERLTTLVREAALEYGSFFAAIQEATEVGNRLGFPLPGGGVGVGCMPHRRMAIEEALKPFDCYRGWPDNYAPVLGLGYDRHVLVVPYTKKF